MCTKVFRGDCIHSGCVPVGAQNPITIDMMIKIPKVFQKMQQGSLLRLFMFYRSVNLTDVRTDSHRLIASAIYKVYN